MLRSRSIVFRPIVAGIFYRGHPSTWQSAATGCASSCQLIGMMNSLTYVDNASPFSSTLTKQVSAFCASDVVWKRTSGDEGAVGARARRDRGRYFEAHKGTNLRRVMKHHHFWQRCDWRNRGKWTTWRTAIALSRQFTTTTEKRSCSRSKTKM